MTRESLQLRAVDCRAAPCLAEGSVAGILGSVPERPGADEVAMKAASPSRPPSAQRLTHILGSALGVGEAGWHPPRASPASHTPRGLEDPAHFCWVWRMREGPATSWERVGTLLARGTALLGIPAGLTVTCGREVSAGRPGGGCRWRNTWALGWCRWGRGSKILFYHATSTRGWRCSPRS